jgi:hypothetical protein
MANKIFKIGTLLYDDDDKAWSLIISVEKSANGFYYTIYDSMTEKESVMTGSGLNRMVEKEFWKVEYEPQEEV